MTYLFFLIVVAKPPAAALGILARPGRREWTWIGLLALAAYLWTTPWDNYLVASGVWNYNPQLVLGITLGWVPLEEYLFFGLQCILSAAWVILLHRAGWVVSRTGRWVAVLAILLAVFAAGTFLERRPLPPGSQPGTYLGLILVWGLPVTLGQILLGRRELAARWPVWALGILAPSLYLTGMDALPLGAGTWTISPTQSLNWFLAGRVPVEEGVFFLMTNAMVVQGMLLALDPGMQARAAVWGKRWFARKNQG